MKFMELLEYELQSVKTYTNHTNYILTPRAFSMDPLWSFLDLLIYILANKGKSSKLEIEDFVEKYFDNDLAVQLLANERGGSSPAFFSAKYKIGINISWTIIPGRQDTKYPVAQADQEQLPPAKKSALKIPATILPESMADKREEYRVQMVLLKCRYLIIRPATRP